jgi:hypothetical protein
MVRGHNPVSDPRVLAPRKRQTPFAGRPSECLAVPVQAGCLHRNPALARTYGTFGGAYGVVGFSGVKDARRASSLPTLQRRLRLECKPSAKPTQTQRSSKAIAGQDRSKLGAK